MFVRDGMNTVVATVGRQQTLRHAATLMTEQGVGAFVVIDDEQPEPSIVTERDILRANGTGEDIDLERVGDYCAAHLVSAAADWPLERAAAEMVTGGFRHLVVMDGADVVGIISMRDILRCWTRDGATCDFPT